MKSNETAEEGPAKGSAYTEDRNAECCDKSRRSHNRFSGPDECARCSDQIGKLL